MSKVTSICGTPLGAFGIPTNSKIPIISAIGHEPDINIIDYVADISLATPSHAAKKVVPERKELLIRVKNIFKNFENNYSNFFLIILLVAI